MKVRSHLLDELGDPDAPVGSRLWCLYVSNEIRKAYYDKTQVGARLKRLVETFAEHHGWHELGFLTWEQYCERKLQIDPERIYGEPHSLPPDPTTAAKYLKRQFGKDWLAALVVALEE